MDVKNMIADTINEFEIDDDKVRVAALSFSDDARKEFALNSYSSKQDIKVNRIILSD